MTIKQMTDYLRAFSSGPMVKIAARLEEQEAALLDCQRYVLENDIDFARVKICGRVSQALGKGRP